MDSDLAYYERRLADELAAARSALNPTARAAHLRLARGYEERIATLARSREPALHVIGAA